MPRRTSSLRKTRQQRRQDIPDVIDGPEYFDFDFRNELSPTAPIAGETRPRTAEVSDSQAAHRHRIDSKPRRRSMDAPGTLDRRIQQAKADDAWIGVASGSPTHPPAGWMDQHKSTSPDQISRSADQLPPLVSSKWRKLGGLFKSKTPPRSEMKSSGLRSSPPVAPHHGSPRSIEQNTSQDHGDLAGKGAISVDALSRSYHPVLPKLLVEIPDVSLDRYSVMFKGISGIGLADIQARKSKMLADLQTTGGDLAAQRAAARPIPSPRRMTDPTMSPKPSYGLFPRNPPVAIKVTAAPQHDALQEPQVHQRSASSPARLCFDPEDVKPRPLQLNRSPVSHHQTSPEDTVTSASSCDQADTFWISTGSSRTSLSSHTSASGINEDIYFDVTSVRDSKDKPDAAFVMTHPQLPAVELARSISKKVRQKQKQPDFNGDNDEHEPETGPNPDAEALVHRLRLSMFDHAIAEVERLASPSDARIPSPARMLNEEGASGDSMEQLMTIRKASALTQSHNQKPTHLQLPSRLQGLAIGIPSPITERSEEGTPVSGRKSPHGSAQPFNIHLVPRATHIAAQASPRTGSSSGRPPVPEKDAKFVPRSKYAINHETIRLDHKRSPRPGSPSSRLAPAAISKSRSPRSSPNPVRKPLAAGTTSSRKPVASGSTSARRVPRSSQTAKLAGSGVAQHSTTRSTKVAEAGIVALSVLPSAEVSIARTVSLSRKPSTQIVLTRTPSVTDKNAGDRSRPSRDQPLMNSSPPTERLLQSTVVPVGA